MNSKIIYEDDKRWNGYIPWFLRHEDFPAAGNFINFFNMLSHRLFQLLLYNEAGIYNISHFGSQLESKCFQRYRHVYKHDVLQNIKEYFDPVTIKQEMGVSLYNDPEETKLRNSQAKGADLEPYIGPNFSPSKKFERWKTEYGKLEKHVLSTRPKREEIYYRPLFIERLGVLEVILQILPKDHPVAIEDLLADIRKYFAESGIMLDIDKKTMSIVLLEEPLLQNEVIENLLPRLKSRFPERADELVKSYHSMLAGAAFDTIFSDTFKTLEQIARGLTNDNKFQFSSKYLQKYFHNLHPTIHETIIKLYSHRGDKAAHARTPPEPHEMRYLLFSICNIALLLLDYKG